MISSHPLNLATLAPDLEKLSTALRDIAAMTYESCSRDLGTSEGIRDYINDSVDLDPKGDNWAINVCLLDLREHGDTLIEAGLAIRRLVDLVNEQRVQSGACDLEDTVYKRTDADAFLDGDVKPVPEGDGLLEWDESDDVAFAARASKESSK